PRRHSFIRIQRLSNHRSSRCLLATVERALNDARCDGAQVVSLARVVQQRGAPQHRAPRHTMDVSSCTEKKSGALHSLMERELREIARRGLTCALLRLGHRGIVPARWFGTIETAETLRNPNWQS